MDFGRLKKEEIDRVRDIGGFPNSGDAAIIELSDPPCYTACPNPFVEDFILENGVHYDEAEDNYHREPFAVDVSEGKNDPVYNAHSYHTKVPHKAIMRYILHYTKPGDIVFDGFCGTGMTGVAAQMCGCPDSSFKLEVARTMSDVCWGSRGAVLSDLSPMATFIAYNYNSPADIVLFEREAGRILSEVEKEYGWMYETQHIVSGMVQIGFDERPVMGRVNHVVYSDVFICPTCSKDMVFWNVAVNQESGRVRDRFACPHCGSNLTKRDCLRAQEVCFDGKLKKTVTAARQIPVKISYSIGKKRYEKKPDAYDMQLLEKIDGMDIPYWYPTDELPQGYNTEQPKRSHGLTHVHQFFIKSALFEMAYFWHLVNTSVENPRIRSLLKFAHTASNNYISKMRRFRADKKGGGPLPGTLYVASLITPPNPVLTIARNVSFIAEAMKAQGYKQNRTCITTGDLGSCRHIPENSIDYIFTDPPFGGNLNYSELSFLWEAWLGVTTNQTREAVMNDPQKKGLFEYQALMTDCFTECYRLLKPGRWMTVEFHNSKNAVWNAIQQALQRSGFIIADVRTLDKRQGSFKQVTTTSAVKQDLVISAYKPKDSFRREFIAQAGCNESAWAFVRQYLEKVSVVVIKNGKIELIAERQPYLLFDRMVAYHMVNGISVPMDAAEFYQGLDKRFLRRDGMYFLADQVNEYDSARIYNDVEPMQFELFVTNEKSAIAWLYVQLEERQTYAEIQLKFMQVIKAVDKYEAMPELAVLLEENFLQDQNGRWYIPDVTKEADVAKLREKKLLKEFEGYLVAKGKLKLFRTEAIRAGFAKLWADKKYRLIAEIAERLPEKVIQEDGQLLIYYDLSLRRA